MSIDSNAIRIVVEDFLRLNPDCTDGLTPLVKALENSSDITSRKTLPGHVTCSGAVIAHGKVLHIHHNGLKKWLLPGGHIEPGDNALSDAALREITEETGIPAENLFLATTDPIDINAHKIPANPDKKEPEHWHYDFCYAFTTTTTTIRLQTEEVSQFSWVPFGNSPTRHNGRENLQKNVDYIA